MINPPPVARHDALSLADLVQMRAVLEALVEAGRAAQEAGFVPVFSLRPGAAPSMMLGGVVMAHLPVSGSVVRPPAEVPPAFRRAEAVVVAEQAPEPVEAAEADPAPSVGVAAVPDLPPRQWAALAALQDLPVSNGFDPAKDLKIAAGLAAGQSVDSLAAELQIEAAALVDRFKALRAPFMKPGDRYLRIEAQADLLAVLRYRATGA
jgi:hypothetical protein